MMSGTVDGLYDSLRGALADQTVAALVIEDELEPVSGAGARIQPATYAGKEKGTFAYAESEAFIPQRDESGWYADLARCDGAPMSGRSVVVDSVGSQSNRVEEALWSVRELIGGLPGIEVTGRDATVERITAAMAQGKKSMPSTVTPEVVKQYLESTSISTWTASHRHVDAWIRYASASDDGAALWVSPNELRDLIVSANTTRDATSMFEHFPNSILFGFWLSSGAVERHRQARIYSSEIVGFDALSSSTAASKYDPLPASSFLEQTSTDSGFTSTIKTKEAGEKKRPSNRGFGMIPGTPEARGFVCGTILRRASVSFAALRAVRFGPDGAAKSLAAGGVLTSLALLGHQLSSLRTNLRSGCELLTVESRYGLRRHGERSPVGLEIPQDPDLLMELVARARREAEAEGLAFADPIQLALSDSEIQQIALSVLVESTTAEDASA